MVEENYQFIVEGFVDTSQIGPALQATSGQLEEWTARTNAQLEGVGNVEAFNKLIKGAEAAALSTNELVAAYEHVIALQRVFEASVAETNFHARLGSIGTVGGASVNEEGLAQIRAMISAEQELRAAAATPVSSAGLNEVGASASSNTEKIVMMEEALLRTQAAAARIHGAEVRGAVGGSRLDDFRDNNGNVNATAAEAEVAAMRAQVAEMAAAKAVAAKKPDEQRILSTSASATAAELTEERKTQQLEAQGTLYERMAQLQEQLVGLSSAQAIATLRVLETKARIAELDQRGVVNDSQRIGLLRQLETAEARLESIKAKEVADSEKLAAAGGGGFFGGLQRGATTGFGGGGGNQGFMAEAGFQLGMVAQYTLYYQLFRDIEEAIKKSIEETVQFEAAVTNLNFILDTTRDHARDVANSLGDVAAQGGLSPAEGVNLGAQAARAFAGEADPATLALQGANVGTQLKVLGGKDVKDAGQGLDEIIAVAKGFNLTFTDTTRILDAATSAAQNFGFANAEAVLPGLGQIGDVAKQSGFSLEETANLIGLISRNNSESATAAAGELRRIFGREGNQAFQNVFANFGVNTTQPFQKEVEQLSQKFGTLSESAKAFIVGQFGGGRAGTAALAVLQDYAELQDNTNKTLHAGGIAQDQFNQRLHDLSGILRTIRGDAANLAKDFGESGVGAALVVALKSADPLLKALDDILKAFNQIPSGIREVGFLGAEIYGGSKLVGALRGRGGDAAAGAGGGAIAEAETTTAAGIKEAGGVLISAVDELAVSLKGEAAEMGATFETLMAEITAAFEAGALSAEEAALAASSLARTGAGGADGAAINAAVDDIVVALTNGAITTEQAFGALNLALGDGVSGLTAAEDLTVEALTTGAVEIAEAIAATTVVMEEMAPPFVTSITSFTDAAIAAAERLGLIATGGGGRGFLSGGALGIGLTAAIGAAVVDQAYRSAENTIKAQNKGATDLTANVNTGDGDSLRSAASTLAADAKAIGQANGGIFGSLTRGIQTLAQGGTNSNTVKGEDEAASRRLTAQADALDKLRQQAALSSDPNALAGLIDLTKPGGVAAGLKTLSDNGRDARTQIGALEAAIKNLATTANGAAQAIGGPIEQKIKATETANTFANTVAQDAGIQHDLYDSSGMFGLGKNDRAGRDASILDKLGPAVQGEFSQDIQDFLAAGGKLDKAGKKQLIDLLQAQVKGYKDFGRLSKQGQRNTLNDVLLAVNGLTRDVQSAKDLDPATIDQAVGQSADAAIKLAASAGQESGVLAGLGAKGADPTGLGQKGVTDTTTLANLKRARSELRKLIKAGFQNVKDPKERAQDILNARNEMQQLNDAIDAAQLQVNTDSVTALQAALALQNSKVASTDKVQIDNNTIASLRKQRDATGDMAAKRAIQAQINTAKQQEQFDQIAQDKATTLAKIDPRDTIGTDRANLANLEATKALYVKLGDTQSAAYEDLLRQIASAKLQIASDVAARLAAKRDANVRSGDPMAKAFADLHNALGTLATDLVITQKYYSDLAAVHQAEAALAQATAARAKQAALLRSDTTDPVATALADLRAARVQLAQDQARKTGNLGADQLAVETAQQAVQKAQFDQQLSNQQTAYQLHRESAGQYLNFLNSQDHAIRNQLAGMKKGAEGYQQLVDELNQIDQLILGLNNEVSGQFNLGDVKVPSIYEVRRSLAESNQQIIDASTTTNNVTLNGVDISQVIAYINSILGVTGTASRAATASRKAA